MAAEVNKDAKEAADRIISEGKTFDYIFGVWQMLHHGDAPLGKSLLYSIGSQSVRNSKGIHVISTGEGGYGKSDGIKQMGKLVHPLFWKNGGVTPQSLYYNKDNKMPDGVIVGLEDVVWQTELGVTVKRITTDFQDGATKLTTIDMVGEEVHSAKRIAFWASCVDNQADEQLRDRFLRYNVKSDETRCAEIIQHMQKQDEGTLPQEDYSETQVCHALTHDLKQKLFHVEIPFATRIKFKGDPRAYALFSDMIKSSAVFNYAIRESRDKDRLIASTNDFENAKSLYIELGGHDRDKFEGADREVLNAIMFYGTDGATQADIQKIAELSAGRVSDILNGRNKEGHGLIHKCHYLIVEEGRPKRYKLRPGNPFEKVSIELTA